MNVKLIDRIATIAFYFIAFLVVSILLGLIGYIFIHGLPKLNWEFLSSPPEIFKAGGGVGPQLFNSF